MKSKQGSKDKAFVFNTFCHTDVEVKQFLKKYVAERDRSFLHAFYDAVLDTKTLFQMEPGDSEVSEENIKGKEGRFLDLSRTNASARSVVERMRVYPVLHRFESFEQNILEAGQEIEIPFQSGKIALFCVTEKRSGRFFDLVLHAQTGMKRTWKSINYCDRGDACIRHSGDIGSLLHYIEFGALAESSPISLTIVGFRKTALHTFHEQKPFIVLVDHDGQLLHFIPCPIDVHSMNDFTMASLCALRRKGGMLQVKVLRTPQGLAGQDTCNMDKQVKNLAESATRAAFESFERENSATAKKSGTIVSFLETIFGSQHGENVADKEKDCDKKTEEAGPCIEPLLHRPIYQLIDHRLLADAQYQMCLENFLSPQSATVLCRGDQMELAVSEKESESASRPPETSTPLQPVKLPLGFSAILEGSPILALCKPASGFPPGLTAESFTATLQTVGLLIGHLHGTGIERCINDASMRANGLFILHADAPANVEGRIEEFLVDLNVTEYTSRRGPCATLLVQIGKKRYFYSGGAHIPGLSSARIPAFAQEVSHVFSDERILQAASDLFQGKVTKPYSNLVPAEYSPGDTCIAFQGEMLSIEAFEAKLKEFSAAMYMDDTNELQSAAAYALVQIGCLLNPAQLKPLRERLLKLFSNVVEQSVEDIKQARANLIAAIRIESPASMIEIMKDEQFQQLTAKLKGRTRAAQRAIGPIIEQLGELVSTRRSSERRLDLSRIAKIDSLKRQNDAIKAMSWDDQVEQLARICTSTGVLFATINPDTTNQLLSCVSQEEMVTKTLVPDQLLAFADRFSCPVDVFTASSLLEVSQTLPHALQASGTSKITLAMPSYDGFSQVAIPLLDKDIELGDPGQVFWAGTPDGQGGCNDPDRYFVRMLLEKTFVHSPRGQELEVWKQMHTPQFAVFMSHLLLNAVEKLCDVLSTNGRHLEEDERLACWGDSTRQTLRGLYGLLLGYLASGAQCATDIWCIVQSNSKVPLPRHGVAEWMLTARFLRHVEQTCWPLDIIRGNAKKLLAKLAKSIVDALVQPMRSQMLKVKQHDVSTFAVQRNKQLAASYFLAYTLLAFPDPDHLPALELFDVVAQKALLILGDDDIQLGRDWYKNSAQVKKHQSTWLMLRLMLNIRSGLAGNAEAFRRMYEFSLGIARGVVAKREHRPKKLGYHIWHVIDPLTPITLAEQEKVVERWKAELEEILSLSSPGQVADESPLIAPSKNDHQEQEQEPQNASAAIKALENIPGNHKALAMAQYLETEQCDVASVLQAAKNTLSTGVFEAIHVESVVEVFRFLDVHDECMQGRLFGGAIKALLATWRTDTLTPGLSVLEQTSF